MKNETAVKKEKKVEFIELVYDLIFVYIVGHNNSILHHIEGGVVGREAFFSYILCTLAVIQIWSFTTFYINIYGRNGVRDHVFLFINMYLLYYIADGISDGWKSTFFRFNIAWALILINIAVQHLIELKNHKSEALEARQLKLKAAVILSEAALVGVNMLVFAKTGVSTSYIPVFFGIIATVLLGWRSSKVAVDFAHLSERIMLYVVFTFGEMIIAIAAYFTGETSASGIYFSTMAFIIVVGLFLSYGTLYNKIIDREKQTNGTGYMMIHVFMIFALNNISVALEFMRDEEVNLLQKTVLLTSSFVMYFAFMFMTAGYAKMRCGFNLKFIIVLLCIAASFIALMLIFREMMYVNIAITVVYIYGIFLMIYRQGKLSERDEQTEN